MIIDEIYGFEDCDDVFEEKFSVVGLVMVCGRRGVDVLGGG